MFARYLSIPRIALTFAALLAGSLSLKAQTVINGDTINGDLTVAGNINGLKIGLGGGSVSTNSAFGLNALQSNTVGLANSAFGESALFSNTEGTFNIAMGQESLYSNTLGNRNVAIGIFALSNNIDGSDNIAIGFDALSGSAAGSQNVAIGKNAGFYRDAITTGQSVLVDPVNSIYLGADARGLNNSESNAIVIGYQAIGMGTNTTVIGNSATTSTKIFGALSQSGGTVITSSPHSFTQTWNASGTNFTGLKSNITNTASGAMSLLLDLQVDGVSMFSVDKAGNLSSPSNLKVSSPLTITNMTEAISTDTGALIVAGGIGVAKDSYFHGVRVGQGSRSPGVFASNLVVGDFYSLNVNTTGNGNIAFGSRALGYNTTGSHNIAIGNDAGLRHANGFNALTDAEKSIYIGTAARGLNNNDDHSIVIGYLAVGEGAYTTVLGTSDTISTKLFGALSQAGGTVTTSKPHNFTQTWNASGTTFTGLKSNITDTASAAGSLLLDLQVDGVSKFSVDKAGNVSSPGNLNITGSATLNSEAILTTVSGDERYLRGDGTSLSFGTSSNAQNAYSVAFGTNARARGDVTSVTPSFAFGKDAVAGLTWAEAGLPVPGNGLNAPEEWTGGAGGVAFGEKSYAGSQSVAMGYESKARYMGVALGTGAQAYGSGSFAAGNYAIANHNAVSIGNLAGTNGYMASGVNSVSIGMVARGWGAQTVALGFYNNALGDSSIVLGRETEAHAVNGVAIGRNTVSNQVGQVVLGSYNAPTTASSTPAPTDDLLVVGNGNGIAADPQERSNAFVIKRNGNAEVKGDLKVEQNATVEGQLIISNPAGGIEMGEFGN